MPAYASPQSGGLRQVGPGEFLTLFDGTEANAAMASIAFARGPSAGQSEAPTTFYASGVVAETITVQASNTNVDADYATIGTLVNNDSPANGNQFFTDTGVPAFYRVHKSGGVAVVKVQR